jgi:lipoprotein Spr
MIKKGMRMEKINRLFSIHNVIVVVALLSLASCSGRKAARTNSSSNTSSKGDASVSIQKKYAELLGVSASNIRNNALYAFIDRWMDTKYKYGSQGSKGFDCSGFTQQLYDEVYKIKLPRSSQDQYKAIANFHRKKHLEEGDLVFFATNGGRKITHVGVYLQNNKFINATTSKGVVISDMTTAYWDDRYIDGGVVR